MLLVHKSCVRSPLRRLWRLVLQLCIGSLYCWRAVKRPRKLSPLWKIRAAKDEDLRLNWQKVLPAFSCRISPVSCLGIGFCAKRRSWNWGLRERFSRISVWMRLLLLPSMAVWVSYLSRASCSFAVGLHSLNVLPYLLHQALFFLVITRALGEQSSHFSSVRTGTTTRGTLSHCILCLPTENLPCAGRGISQSSPCAWATLFLAASLRGNIREVTSFIVGRKH